MKPNSIKYFIPVLAGVFIALHFQSCDVIDGSTRENNASIDTTCTFDADTTPIRKKVLMEDYTGYLCGNCPQAGIYLNDTLAPIYGDSLVVISVHAAFFAIPCGLPGGACPGTQPAGSFQTDFRCPAGEDWYDQFNIPTNPLGLVNRAAYGTSNFFVPKSKWATKINDEFAVAPEAKIRIKNTYDPATRNLRICIESKFLSSVIDTFNLQVVLIEDSLIDWQLWYNHSPEYVPDYIHRHVLRQSVNGSFGPTIASGNISAGQTVVNGYNLTLNSSWAAPNCKVVAFIYDADNYRVLQVEEADVIE